MQMKLIEKCIKFELFFYQRRTFKKLGLNIPFIAKSFGDLTCFFDKKYKLLRIFQIYLSKLLASLTVIDCVVPVLQNNIITNHSLTNTL